MIIRTASDDRQLPGSLARLHIIAAAYDASPVSGYTHNFYKYPARFSPQFVRAVIDAFSRTGDLVLDPFMGGGTTLVEALASGRRTIGVDINSLAVFVSKVKTTILTETDILHLEHWLERLPQSINIHDPSTRFSDYAEAGYYRYLDLRTTWRLRKTIEQALLTTQELGFGKLRAFSRCVVLRTAQWALDGRKRLPTVAEFRTRLLEQGRSMIAGARLLRSAAECNASQKCSRVMCIKRSVIGLEQDPLMPKRCKAKLILTSPPYPGIHVLYHRWQVDGRKESPAPFWIADQLDGAGESHYTLGDRKEKDLSTYFQQLGAALGSLRHFCDRDTILVQVVAFSNPSWQLDRYLEINKRFGFIEFQLPELARQHDGRLRRVVPNRKWHADQLGDTPASQEIVLFHRYVES